MCKHVDGNVDEHVDASVDAHADEHLYKNVDVHDVVLDEYVDYHVGQM